ncbi:hypothetical protein FNV43_RR17800 [Rhamnella rubrinervis]|uniref:Neutral/alkaline non-lysosomal ceramidase N-terminal domain-containing protein n=1 Tax=Rhamnella rubrinervis TaxID=2594499 RepID=A0A8K0EA34_9ROSA|nr:hypothetical protein FNV43_RR17800 [Rhamnella rubrinervis]
MAMMCGLGFEWNLWQTYGESDSKYFTKSRSPPPLSDPALHWRLRDSVKTMLSCGNEGDDIHVVIVGLTNTYSQYVNTFEEYEVQRYEIYTTGVKFTHFLSAIHAVRSFFIINWVMMAVVKLSTHLFLSLQNTNCICHRRLRDSVRTMLSTGNKGNGIHIVIAGLNNTYSQYANTFEEYEVQKYEELSEDMICSSG